MAFIHTEIFHARDRNRRSLLGIIALSISIIALVMIFENRDTIGILNPYRLEVAPTHRSNLILANITETTNNIIMIKNVDNDFYPSASVELPRRLYAQEPVAFRFDISHNPRSSPPVQITITGDKGQYRLFFPNPNMNNNNSKIQFEYTFLSAGLYNVDITFGAPEGTNFNIHVEPPSHKT